MATGGEKGRDRQSETLTARVGDRGRLTLPEEVKRHLGVKTGDMLVIRLDDAGEVRITAGAVVERDQAWFFHPEMQSRVREAEEDSAEGRATRVTSARGLRAHLNRVRRG